MVKDAINAYRFMESGQMQMVLGLEPPHRLIEAIGFYHLQVTKIRNKQMEQETEERRRELGANRMASKGRRR